MDQLKATKTSTLANGITMWQINTTSGKIISENMARGANCTEEEILNDFRAFLHSKACNSDINVRSYYKNSLQGVQR